MRSIFLRVLFVLCLAINADVVSAQSSAITPAYIEAAKQQLAIEKERNSLASDRLQALQNTQQSGLNEEDINADILERNKLDIGMTRVDLLGINLALVEVNQTLTATETAIRELQEQIQEIGFTSGPSTPAISHQLSRMQANLGYQQEFLKLTHERAKELTQALAMAKKRLELQQNWDIKLQELTDNKQHKERLHTLDQLILALQQQQQSWVQKLTALNRQANQLLQQGKTANDPAYKQIALYVFEAEERSDLIHLQLVLARLNTQIEDLAATIKGADSGTHLQRVTHLQKVSQQTESQLDELNQIVDLLRGKMSLITQRLDVEKQRPGNTPDATQRILTDLASAYQRQMITAINLGKEGAAYQVILQQKLRSALARRQGLPGFNFAEWVSLGKDLFHMSAVSVQAVRSLQEDLATGLAELSVWQGTLLATLEIGWLVFWIGLRRYLNHIAQKN